MRVVIQRVSKAVVSVDSITVGEIDEGLVILVGFTHEDDRSDLEWMRKKVSHLRIFDDEDGKMNRSVLDIAGSILVVSQFTLLASTKKGNRPSYIHAARPENARMLYDMFVEGLQRDGLEVNTGTFGAMMKVELTNDGPVTIIIDSKLKA